MSAYFITFKFGFEDEPVMRAMSNRESSKEPLPADRYSINLDATTICSYLGGRIVQQHYGGKKRRELKIKEVSTDAEG